MIEKRNGSALASNQDQEQRMGPTNNDLYNEDKVQPNITPQTAFDSLNGPADSGLSPNLPDKIEVDIIETRQKLLELELELESLKQKLLELTVELESLKHNK